MQNSINSFNNRYSYHDVLRRNPQLLLFVRELNRLLSKQETSENLRNCYNYILDNMHYLCKIGVGKTITIAKEKSNLDQTIYFCRDRKGAYDIKF